MKRIKGLYNESFLSEIIFYIVKIIKNIVPAVKESYFVNGLLKLWTLFEKYILTSPFVKFFFDPEYTVKIWYKSRFYRVIKLWVRRLSRKFEKAYLPYDSIITALFLVFIIITPQKVWYAPVWVSLFAALVVFYVSHNINNKTGTVFVIISTLLMVFVITLILSFPYSAVTSLVYMLLGIDLFFLVSFSLKSYRDLEKMMMVLFCACAIQCTLGFAQNAMFSVSAHAFLSDGVSFGEEIVLIFPFAMTYAIEFVKGKRKYPYMGFIFILTFNAVIASRSRAAYIAFIIEIAVLFITDKKFSAFIFLLIPLGLGSLASNMRKTFQATAMHGNITGNMITLFQKFWKSGFGVSSEKFLSIYNSANPNYQGNGIFFDVTQTNISPIYINFFIDVGAIVMAFFMIYILRVAHSALTYQIIGEKKYKKFFTAGFAMLAGLSVSSFLETTMFSSRTMLLYWAMLGILRGIRSMSLSKNQSLYN